MLSKTFLWIEDRKGKASYIFWNSLLNQLCPDIIVESKKNSSELVRAVRNLNNANNCINDFWDRFKEERCE